jgi:lauroyl/myristoyl acyltransferase
MNPYPTDRQDLAQGLDSLFQALPQPLLARTAQFLALESTASIHIDNRSVAEVVAAVLGPLPPGQAPLVAQRLLLTEFKNICVARAWQSGGLAALAELIQCPQARKLQELHAAQSPAILVFGHIGARFCVGPALQRIGVPAAIFAKFPPDLAADEARTFAARLPGMEYLELGDGGDAGALVLGRAVERLRKCGIVAIGIDGSQGGSGLPMRFLGRRLTVGRGPAMLARVTGAPIIPIVLAFTTNGWGIELHIGEPLPRPTVAASDAVAFDRDLTQSALQWFEQYLRAAPEQLRLARLIMLSQAPLFTAAGGRAGW